MLDLFLRAIDERRKVRLTFFSKEDRGRRTRTCAPMDYGPSRMAHNPGDRYHLWDYESAIGPHTLSLPPHQIIAIEATDESFDPAEFVTWDVITSPWHIRRDWGRFS